MVEIRRLGEADAEACDAVVASLPYHFGDEGGRDACAEAVRTQPGLVATTDGGDGDCGDQVGVSRWTQAVACWVSSAALFRFSFRLICSR